MELKKGYKQTTVGVIPNDWDVMSLNKICHMKSGAGITSANIDQFSKYPCYGGNGLRGFTNQYTHDGQYALIGRQGALCGNVLGVEGKFFASEHAIVVTPLEQTYIHWLTYVLGEMRLNQYSESSAQPGLSVWKLLMLNLAFPPNKAEQRAIAAAMSDVDSLLTALDSLIGKKRLVKQGAMQELLTGKRRLSGFIGKWETKTLADVCSFINDGTHFTPKYVNNGVPFYSVENVTANEFTNTKFISQQEHDRLIKRCKPEKGDILMTRIGSLGDTKLIDWDVNASIYVSLALLKVNRQAIDERFLYCYTKSRKFIKDLEARSLVYAIPQKINMAEIGGVPILVPSVPEQQAIAEIMGDMDAEISALETRREKTRQLKEGMTQELLTGRIRLV